jgi:rhamnosyltransferase
MSRLTSINPKSIGGVVVSYHPDPDFGERLATLAAEVGPLIVVDNSTFTEARERVRTLGEKLGVFHITNPENRGLAAALNDAFRRHHCNGVTWVIAFDQDSTPEQGFAVALLATADRAPLPSPAIVGANWHDEGRPEFASQHLQRHPLLPFLFRRRPAPVDLTDVTCVITSGSLFHLPTWRALGGFDETLFLDLVDTDYCLRATRAGHSIRVAAEARLLHRRGAKQPVYFLGRTFWPAFMPPLRLRYLFRNRMRLVARHALHAPHWVAFELVYALKIVAEVVFLERDKIVKLSACIRGTWDGLLGRKGKIS